MNSIVALIPSVWLFPTAVKFSDIAPGLEILSSNFTKGFILKIVKTT